MLIKADYAQIELAIMAQLSGDPTMTKAFEDGVDLHQLTASLVMDKSLHAVTSEERQLAKSLNFALIYGAGPRGLAAYAANNFGISLTEEEAQHFRDRWFESFKGVRQWHQRHRNDRQTRAAWGRRRVLHPDAYISHRFNSPVQGTGADLLKLALVHCWETPAPPDARVVAVVHDEIQIEAPVEHANEAAAWVKAAMEKAAAEILTVPVTVEIKPMMKNGVQGS